jgi:hypothetical protein
VRQRLRLLRLRPGRLLRPRVRLVLGRQCTKRSETKTSDPEKETTVTEASETESETSARDNGR